MTRYLPLFLLVVVACTFTQKIRDGKTAYERKQFHKAIGMLQDEYNKEKSRVEKGKIAFMLADSYRKTDEHNRSLEWFKTAYDYSYGPDALKAFAYGLKAQERYSEAMQAFNDLGIEIGSKYEYRREITACQNAINWQKAESNKDYVVKPLPFNTVHSDFSPAMYRNGKLVFTSDRSGSTGDDPYHWTGNEFMDLFVTEEENESAELFDPNINSPMNEGTVTFEATFSTMYFTRCYDTGMENEVTCRIMTSEWTGNEWGIPKPLPFMEDGFDYRHPAISGDGSILIFSSNHPDGWGGFDLYSARLENGKWGDPTLMSRSINSIGNELFPYLHRDTLYFSSDFLSGMGGLDIFKTYPFNKSGWIPAQNLKAPINSGADDFGMVVLDKHENNVLQSGYFSSSRTGGNGKDDIYKFEKRKITIRQETVKKDRKLFLDVYVLEKIFSDPNNPNSRVLGRKPLQGASLSFKPEGTSENILIGEEGIYSIELKPQTEYQFQATMPHYFSNQVSFSTVGIASAQGDEDMRFEVEIVLDKIYKEREITLENIYYDFDKWDIRLDAQPTLIALSKVLKNNPDISIELASHTDCRGSAKYNQALSQKRAESVVSFLIINGINGSRLTAKGYGEEIPSASCICSRCTEEEHQANRRTTFKVL